MTARTTRIAWMLAVTAIAAAAAFIVSSRHDTASSAVASDPTSTAAQASFGLLRRSQTVSDRTADAFADGRGEINPTSVRTVQVDGQSTVAVGTGPDEVCIEGNLGAWGDGERAGVCGTPQDTAQQGLFGGVKPAPAVVKRLGLKAAATREIALLPDGVQSVQLTDASGTHTVPVHENIAIGYLDGAATAVSYRIGGTTRSIDLGGAR